jgi:Rod binding domain-containing protein
MEMETTPGLMNGSDVTATLLQKQAGAAARSKNAAQIKDSSEQFESVFMTQMLSHMFEGIEPDPMFGGGPGEEVYKSFLLDEYGKSIVKRGGLGLTTAVQAELLRMQEAHGGEGANG